MASKPTLPTHRVRRATVRPKPALEELLDRVAPALDARDFTTLARLYGAISAKRRDGRVGRRRACPVCLALSRSELGGEVLHAEGCALEAALNQVEAFIATGLRSAK